ERRIIETTSISATLICKYLFKRTIYGQLA
ncbi:MAG: hypothetical protein ACI9J5_003524, partial [Paraglaciecola sp.]